MSIQLIQQYHAQVEKIIRYGGSRKESSVRKPFQDLLEAYARQRNLEMIAELDYRTRKGHTIYPDGTLKDALRQDWGYWESKDEYDDLNLEIEKKFAKGYPCNNILFEDTQTAVLYQACEEVARVDFLDAAALDALLTQFVSYESREVREFREAIENFTSDIPALGEMLREAIRTQYEQNASFQKAAKDFLELCQEAINPNMDLADVREMIVQHVLTEDIFITIFDEPQFHRENIIAHELGEVVGTFYKGQVRREIDGRIAVYTRAIKARAAQIYNHQEKQKFLKVLYENFYKAYNPKAADRLGIVYTPNEIVRFMIEAADHLCFKHFGKTLGDVGVDILDPTTGTGTYVTELIEYLPPHQLEHKYKHELHCNEVAILPYYIANLNIEYTYKQKMGRYEPFENIVFVDTLDNMGFKTGYVRQLGLFGLTDENSERIERQNKRDISIIIGNPPYNTHQINFNEGNPNRKYPSIDSRIQDTYIKQSNAQNLTKLYDMYTRFYRWASDRLGDNGIICFITNNSFIDARTYDGFRKSIKDEFDYAYIIDLGGNIRKLSGRDGIFLNEEHTIFGVAAAVGIAIMFLVKKESKQKLPCKINYIHPCDIRATRNEKISYIREHPFREIPFQEIKPDRKNNWINITDNDWDELIPVASKQTKQSKISGEIDSIFKQFSMGMVTARDDWAIDFSETNLANKMGFFTEMYNAHSPETGDFDTTIKWSRNLKRNLRRGLKETFDKNRIRPILYRPFCKFFVYDSDIFINDKAVASEMLNQDDYLISFTAPGSEKPFLSLVSNNAVDYHLTSAGCIAQCLPFHRYDDLGNRVDNITKWALRQFKQHYPQSTISKKDIFHYVYAVLHNPLYRAKYKLNLKREFPRIPFYENFEQWAAWGEQLMQLHLNYETSDPFPLERTDIDLDDTRKAYKARLKANKKNGRIELDTITTLSGIPKEAWEYKLGNRSALEWILDRYKERKPRDPTIREKFNTYRFIDYKEQVIDLLMRVCTVSVETMKIINQMEKENPES